MSLRTLSVSWRGRLPDGVGHFARQLMLRWGIATAPWRLDPGFIVIGAQRAGTTTLFRLLSEHPDIVRPTASKGINYFDLNYQRGMRWYRGHFPLRFGRQGRLAFESSGYYLLHPMAAERITRDLPGVRVVVAVREPVERAYSAHKHELARGFETEPFETAIKLEESRLAGEIDRIREDPTYESYALRHYAYLTRSRYVEQIDRFTALLGEDRVFVLDADAFFADPVPHFHRLTDWLGVPRWTPERVDKWNPEPRRPLTDELRAELDDYFAPYDEALRHYLGAAPSWRNRNVP